jgi:hypothetical protein
MLKCKKKRYFEFLITPVFGEKYVATNTHEDGRRIDDFQFLSHGQCLDQINLQVWTLTSFKIARAH